MFAITPVKGKKPLNIRYTYASSKLLTLLILKYSDSFISDQIILTYSTTMKWR